MYTRIFKRKYSLFLTEFQITHEHRMKINQYFKQNIFNLLDETENEVNDCTVQRFRCI